MVAAVHQRDAVGRYVAVADGAHHSLLLLALLLLALLLLALLLHRALGVTLGVTLDAVESVREAHHLADAT